MGSSTSTLIGILGSSISGKGEQVWISSLAILSCQVIIVLSFNLTKTMKTITQNQLNTFVLVAIVLILSFVISLSVFAKSETDMGKSSMHSSIVSHVVNELNKIAERDGGIGKELKDVAKEQNELKEKTVEAVKKIENRSGLKTFFMGTDYKNLGMLRSVTVTIDNHINRLMRAKERAINPATVADVEEEILLLQAEKTSLETFIKDNEDKFSIFGWFVKLFNK